MKLEHMYYVNVVLFRSSFHGDATYVSPKCALICCKPANTKIWTASYQGTYRTLDFIIHSIISSKEWPSCFATFNTQWTHNIVCVVSGWCHLPVQLALCLTILLPPTHFLLHVYTFLPTSAHTHVQYGHTALLVAADQEHEDVVQLLIEVDADPDLQHQVIYRSPVNYETKQQTVNCTCSGCTCDVTAAMHVNIVSVVEFCAGWGDSPHEGS